MRIFVIGATGILGRALMPRLQQTHHEIRTLVRSLEQARTLQAIGIEATVGEILRAETQQHLPELVKGCEAVIHIATAIPSNPSAPGAWEINTRLRTEGTRHLLEASLQALAASSVGLQTQCHRGLDFVPLFCRSSRQVDNANDRVRQN